MAGSKKLEALRGSHLLPLLDSSKYIKLSFLDRKDAIELIRQPAANSLQFSDAVVQDILDLSAGQPFYTQLLCQGIFDIAMTDGADVVSSTHVDRAVQAFLVAPTPHLILTWNALAFDQEVAGVALANRQEGTDEFVSPREVARWLSGNKSPLVLRTSQVEHSLLTLRDIDWIEKKPAVAGFRFTMELVRQWILENRSINDLAEKYRKELLSLIPSYLRLTAVGATDLLLLLAAQLCCGLLFVHLPKGIELLGPFQVLITILYFLIPLLLRRATVGMLLWHLRILRQTTQPAQTGDAVGYAALLALRALCLIGLLVAAAQIIPLPMVPRIFAAPLPDAWSLPIILGAAGLVVLDNLMGLFGRRKQGLCELASSIIIVPASLVSLS